MSDPPSGRLLLVAGEPDADPHQLARAVAARLPRALHVDLERLGTLVVTGAVALVDPPAPEAVEQLFLRWLAGIAVAETYQRAGFDAVLSDRVTGDFLADLLDFVDPAPVHLVLLGDASSGARRAPGTGLLLGADEGSVPEQSRAVLERLDEALVRRYVG